jgi:hypothetical protein
VAVTTAVIERALRSLGAAVPERGRNPLLPAAVRVERSRLRTRRGDTSDQTALTLWFGEGPALPGPSGTLRAARIAARAAVLVVGAAAVGALSAAASQREAERLEHRDAPRLAG